MANEDTFHLGIKALIRNNQGKILILHANMKLFDPPRPDHWDLPGGRVQREDEDLEKTLSREAKEEIGIKKKKIIKFFDSSVAKLRISGEEHWLILFTYLCSIGNTENISLTDDEHTEFKWCFPKEATKLLSVKFSDEFVEKLAKL